VTFKFNKCAELFIGAHNETLSIVAVGINNPDCSPARIQGRDAAPTPSSFAEIVTD
jgi:hypothetical protein